MLVVLFFSEFSVYLPLYFILTTVIQFVALLTYDSTVNNMSIDPSLLRTCSFILNPSDLITALSYFIIPFIMIFIWRQRKDLPLTNIFLMFGFFIVCCGTTHLVAVWNIWSPSRALIAMTFWKCITAIVSFVTALMLIHAIPLALSIPSRAQLELEVTERKIAQQKLQQQYDNEMIRRDIIDNIRKYIKIQDILDISVEQLGTYFRASRCTVHFNLDNMLQIEAEYCRALMPPVRVRKLEVRFFM